MHYTKSRILLATGVSSSVRFQRRNEEREINRWPEKSSFQQVRRSTSNL